MRKCLIIIAETDSGYMQTEYNGNWSVAKYIAVGRGMLMINTRQSTIAVKMMLRTKQITHPRFVGCLDLRQFIKITLKMNCIKSISIVVVM